MPDENPTPEEALTEEAGMVGDPGVPADAAGDVPPAVAGEEVESAEEVAADAAPEPDYKDEYVRAVAELDNVRKRARRDVGVAEGRGIGKLAKALLPALDNLDRAIAAAEAADNDPDDHLTRGIRLVQQELLGALTKVGIETDSPKGEAFDPHKHEAISQVPVEGTPAGTVVDVYQAGYRYQDTVLRAAKVVVAA